VERVVRSARRRLGAQTVFDGITGGLTLMLFWFLVWLLVEPLLLEPAPAYRRWNLLGFLLINTVVVAVGLGIYFRPSRLKAALELDARFQLRERVTSALTLPDALRHTSAGEAVLADAEAHAAGLCVKNQFPVRLRRSAVRIPILAGLIALVAFVYHPVTDNPAWADAKRQKAADAARVADAEPKPPPAERKPGEGQRPEEKPPSVHELEAELDRLERQQRPSAPDAAREKVAAITPLEDRVRAAERDRHDRLVRVEDKLRQLDKLAAAAGFKGGPADGLNDALAGGDLKKAEDEVERLRKKLQDPKLDPKEAEQLARQLERMADELQRLSRNQEQAVKLQKLVDQAKKEGRDAEALQRELEQLKANAATMKELEQLAESLRECEKCLEAGQPGDAAKQLERIAGQLRGLEGQAKELQDLQGQLERLTRMKAAAAAAAGLQPGDGQGQQPGRSEQPGRADNAPGGGVASGARPENPNAAGQSVEARQRAPFDPTGRRAAAGSSFGPGFTKKSPSELGPVIPRAAQAAQDAVSTQPLTKDEKEAVGEFFREPKK
jgi:uncharacterized coiled-coil DUF342 family protein